MRPSSYIPLLAGAAIAQESATILNFFQLDSTLTVLGSDASATTYENSCPSDGVGVSVVPSDLLPITDDPSETPSPTPAPRMRRQDDDSNEDYSFCEPYTILQGPETYEMHLTDPTPGAWTMDMACSWQGAMSTADLTCDVTQSGYVPDQADQVASTSVLSQSEIQEMEAYQVVALVTATGASYPGSASATGGPSPTGSASGTGPTSPSRSQSGAASTPSTGLAPAGSLPNAMAMTTSRSKQGLLSELSWAQSLTARLRRDRDNWRSLALEQEQDLKAAHQDLEHQTCVVSEIEQENANLRFRHEEDRTAGGQLYSRFQILVSAHDKLVDQLNDAMRTIARLKKSDRTKDKVQQRNLSLKATLHRYTSQGTSATTQAAADTESTLREALALANERIEELETKGGAMLDALEKRNDSCGSDEEEEMGQGDVEAGMLEAEVAFRGVIEDESFKEQKVLWLDLLDG
ncbi:uncharacterized protein J4E87_007412 [Alternaria ethzedia]|uniref:uncharacterized protein n=1 Tax=Alternaria ethzedia TaxID=181014 RepID=UPI0020C1C330|nr:uncharacterized protein J4E87_007412 [Alternaria ethzedia]KAI4619522.1 hypothetical protein J4E87_007412 [Alternaria ethzedia]